MLLINEKRNIKPLNKEFYPDIILLITQTKLDLKEIYTCNGNDYHCIYNYTGEYQFSAWIKN